MDKVDADLRGPSQVHMAPSPPHIGINLLFFHGQLPGIGMLAKKTLQSVLEISLRANDYRFAIFTTRLGEESLMGDPNFRDAVQSLRARVDIVAFDLDPKKKLRRLLFEQTRLSRLASRTDLLHSVDYSFPLFARTKAIISVNDLNYLNFPRTFSRSQRLVRQVSVPVSLRRADKVVTISHAAKREIGERFPFAAKKIEAVHLGLDSMLAGVEVSEELELPDRYILSVSTLRVHKNFGRLIEAVARLEDDRVHLVIAGRDDGMGAELRRLSQDFQVADRVDIRGFVSDDQLLGLYRNATVYITPSLYEGFGLTPLEAMGHGLPVACSDLEVLREVSGDAARYFDPTDVDAIAAALDSLLGDSQQRKALIEAGRERIKLFSWHQTGKKIISLYEEVLGAV